MFTDIYKIDDSGEISFYATYSLPAEEALKCAIIQRSKNYNTWNYNNIYVPIKNRNGRFYFESNKEMFFTNS